MDVYTFKAGDGAKKIFDADPAAKSNTAQLGDGARVYGQSIVFHKGTALVRIVFCCAMARQAATWKMSR